VPPLRVSLSSELPALREAGRLGGWEAGRLGGWEAGRLGGWKILGFTTGFLRIEVVVTGSTLRPRFGDGSMLSAAEARTGIIQGMFKARPS
jgi:hypothetical protein